METMLLEEALYHQLSEKFINPCDVQVISMVYFELYTIKEVQVAICTLFDRVRIIYRHFESIDKRQKVFTVSAQFDSLQFSEIQSCFPDSDQAKKFFNLLKKNFCE